MAIAKITKRTVDGLRADGGGSLIWDTELPGFGVKVSATGRKTYVVQYRTGAGRRGRTRRMKIGSHGALTPDAARLKAKKILGAVANGKDPAADLAADRKAGTVAELCEHYLVAVSQTKKASTIATDSGRIRRHIVPLLGRLAVNAVKRQDVEKFIRDVADGRTAADEKTGPRGRAIVKGGKGTAARTAGLLGSIFTFAVAEGIRPDNPVRGVKRYSDRKITRYLTADQLTALGTALTAAEQAGENATALAAIRVLLLTGCRKSEILTLRWDDVDLSNGRLHLRDAKTGPRDVLLSPSAALVIQAMPRLEGNPHVFPGERTGHHLVGLQKIWQRVRQRAGLDELRLHDLRHAFASVGISIGAPLAVVGHLLGHRDIKSTAQYAHLLPDPARNASNRIAGALAGALNGSAASITSISRKRR